MRDRKLEEAVNNGAVVYRDPLIYVALALAAIVAVLTGLNTYLLITL